MLAAVAEGNLIIEHPNRDRPESQATRALVVALLLASREELAAVRARVAAAGLEVHAHRGGFLVRDPWETAVAFRVG